MAGCVKKIAALIVAVSLAAVFAVPAGAKGLTKFDKSSYSEYLDKNLKMKQETIVTFDDMLNQGVGSITSQGKKGNALVSTALSDGTVTAVNMPAGSFHFSVDDKFRQTVKMWVYVSDIDKLACDHDSVGAVQEGSGTLWITLSTSGGVGHTWQHTFGAYQSGWHEIELSFLCHNVAYGGLKRIDYSDLNGLNIWCNAKAGLELRFDEMRLVTYSNPNYEGPGEAPYGGRWLSTCDYDALDGANLTEWYGSYYDLEDKTQGSSCLAITGHRENTDHRIGIGVDSVLVNYEEDSICFDMYISDLKLAGSDWQFRLEHNAQAAHYTVNFATILVSAVDGRRRPTALKNGWNHIQIPFKKTGAVIGDGYTKTFADKNFELTQLMFFVAGTGESDKENYVLKYDNIYVAKTADIMAANGIAEESASGKRPASSAALGGESSQISELSGTADALVTVAVVAVIGAAAIAVIVIKKKRPSEGNADTPKRN